MMEISPMTLRLPILIIAPILSACLLAGAAKASVPDEETVTTLVAMVAGAELGQAWVPTAIAIARRESRMRCDALGKGKPGQEAAGVFQVLPIAAKHLGFDYRRIRKDCIYSIYAGIAHMRACLASNGNRMNHRQMKLCHVHGINGWRLRYG